MSWRNVLNIPDTHRTIFDYETDNYLKKLGFYESKMLSKHFNRQHWNELQVGQPVLRLDSDAEGRFTSIYISQFEAVTVKLTPWHSVEYSRRLEFTTPPTTIHEVDQKLNELFDCSCWRQKLGVPDTKKNYIYDLETDAYCKGLGFSYGILNPRYHPDCWRYLAIGKPVFKLRRTKYTVYINQAEVYMEKFENNWFSWTCDARRLAFSASSITAQDIEMKLDELFEM
ncbi:hypothetical protein [Paenibacillus tyrfis]|uniref:hypothetical protein n=1 Tax=Paenibacillus tyrfis TaxID=1501230 RepID=UPI000B592D2E|nr:hypothetical protein [Paenibacillus tyrfis]